MLKLFLFSFLILYCSTAKEKETWREESIFLKSNEKYPIVELYTSPDEEGIAPAVKLKYLVDTGSNISFIKKEFLPSSNKGEKFTSYTIAGKTEISIQKMNLKLVTSNNEKLTQSHTFHMMKFTSDFPFDGILGNDFLNRYTTLIDFPNGIYLFLDEKQLSSLPFIPISIEESIKSHLIVPIQFQNKKLLFLLDTGAEISFIDEDEVASLNLKAHKSRKFVNLTGDLLESNTYLIPKLCLTIEICENDIEFLSNKSLRNFLGNEKVQLSGLFGMNWIKNYYLLLKHPERKLYLLRKTGSPSI